MLTICSFSEPALDVKHVVENFFVFVAFLFYLQNCLLHFSSLLLILSPCVLHTTLDLVIFFTDGILQNLNLFS